ncbi:MAG TPA: addiction module protein [Phycisphaerae bacterium]|nr:addiction module protein [Phycisphaerae bacterium]
MIENDLIERILSLPADDRELVVDVVLASLSKDSPPQLTPEEQAELLRRAEAFRQHPESFIPWEQVKEELAKQRARRSA